MSKYIDADFTTVCDEWQPTVTSGEEQNIKDVPTDDVAEKRERMRISFELSDHCRSVRWSHDGFNWHRAEIETLIQVYEQQTKCLLKEQYHE